MSTKPKNTASEVQQFRDGFNPEEAQDVEINRSWLQPEAGSVVHFLPLERSGDVREMFPPKNPKQANDRSKYLWLCELMGPAVLYRDQQPVQGKPGDVFLMFEPKHPGIRDLIRKASEAGHPMTLINKGKQPRHVRSFGGVTDVWTYDAKLTPRKFAPLSNLALLTMPKAEDVAKAALPESITQSDETGD